jgi:pyruvate kinase
MGILQPVRRCRVPSNGRDFDVRGDRVVESELFEPQELDVLARQLEALAARLLEVEDDHHESIARLRGAQLASGRNLLHYLALRQEDVRDLQKRLAHLGLSSLGRAEAHVLGNIRAVLRVLHGLAGHAEPTADDGDVPGFGAGHRFLERRLAGLLGPGSEGRSVRILVTLPSEAAEDYRLVRDCLAAGMDCARINCAHDDPVAWERMVIHVRRAQRELGRDCRVLMDLAGPKLRTGPIHPGPQIVHWKPWRDARGRVCAPARIWMTPWPKMEPAPAPASAELCVDESWLAKAAPGDTVEFVDARGAKRTLRFVETVGSGCWAESLQTAYVGADTELRLRRQRGGRVVSTIVRELPRHPGTLRLRPGDELVLVRAPTDGVEAAHDEHGRPLRPATISCTLPEAFGAVRPGERILFDDGRIAGLVRAAGDGKIRVEITHARPEGTKLHADRGINFPDSDLQLPALTNTDIAHLPFIAQHADLVGLSFVQCPEDVLEVQSRLRGCRGGRLGIVLKIETRRAFERLPDLLLAALRSDAAGVMIARGDLAVDCGWERLAEVQEEILWICEAAHVPVVWATQVLESLAKNGLPSRPEITDAAMGVRAEAVMLNKGPHVVDAIRVLDGILRRMQGHQSKKTPRLRPLRSWGNYGAARLDRRVQPLDGWDPLRCPGAEAGAFSGTSSI